MLSRATYCTREDVLAALQVASSPRSYPAVDRAIESATTSIDHRCHRTFHPYAATKLFGWPDPSSSALSWRLWLDGNDLLSLTALVSGGVTINDYFLEPQRYGPPYTHIEIDISAAGAFSVGATTQRAISATGLWGFTDVTADVSVLVGAMTSDATSLVVADGSQVGIGDLLLIGLERMIVTGRRMADTGATLLTAMIASAADVSVAVADGSAFAVGEVVLLGSESMLILDVVVDTLIVERAVNSSVLAAHTGSAIYAARQLIVTRAANGTSAAGHTDASTVKRSGVPGPVRSLAVAEAIVELQQGSAGYARTAGSGDNERVIGAGAGLSDLRDQVEAGFRRKVRTRAV